MDAARLDPPRRLIVPIRNRWGDGEMSVLDFGDPKRPADMIFAHANGFNARTYRSLLAPLGGTFRILAPDLRGHGASRLPTRFEGRRNWHDHRDDLLALMEAIGGPPVVLAGHSMGGSASLLAAAEQPDRVSRLVLFDPVFWGRPMSLMMQTPILRRLAEFNPLVKATLRRRSQFPDRKAALAAYRGRGAFKGWSDSVLADYLADGLEPTDDGMTLACSPRWEASNYAAQAHDMWGALARVRQPVHVLKAEHGSLCHLADSPRHPNLSVEVIEGSGHLFPMTHPDAARDALFEAMI